MRRGLTDRSLDEGSDLESKRNARTEYFRINVTTATATPRLTEFGDRIGEVEMQLPENFVSIRDKILDAEMAVMKLNVPLSKLPQCEVNVIDKITTEYPDSFSLISDQKIFVLPLGWSKKNSASISLSTTRYESLYDQSYFEQNPNGISWSVSPVNVSPPHFYELNQSNLLSIINRCLQEGKREYNTIAEYFADLSLASTDVLKQAVPAALMSSYLRLANLWFTLDTDNTISLHYIPPLLDINLHTPMISCEGYTSDMRSTNGTLFDDTSKAMPFIQDGNRTGYIIDGVVYSYKLDATTVNTQQEGRQTITYGSGVFDPVDLDVRYNNDRLDAQCLFAYREYIAEETNPLYGYFLEDNHFISFVDDLSLITAMNLPLSKNALETRLGHPISESLTINGDGVNRQMVYGSYTTDQHYGVEGTGFDTVEIHPSSNPYTSRSYEENPYSFLGYVPNPPVYTDDEGSRTTTTTTTYTDSNVEPPSVTTYSEPVASDEQLEDYTLTESETFFQIQQNSSSVVKVTATQPWTRTVPDHLWNADISSYPQSFYAYCIMPIADGFVSRWTDQDSQSPRSCAIFNVSNAGDIHPGDGVERFLIRDEIDYVTYNAGTQINPDIKRAYPAFSMTAMTIIWKLWGPDHDDHVSGENTPFYSAQLSYKRNAPIQIQSVVERSGSATYSHLLTRTKTETSYELTEANSDSIKIDPFVIGGNLSLKKMFPSLPWIKISKNMFYSDAIRDVTTSSYVPIERQINPQIFIDASSRGNGESDENLYILDTRQTSASVLTTHPYKVLLGSNYEVYKIPEFVLKFTASDAVSLTTINSILLTMNGVVFNQEVYPVNFTSLSASSAQTGTIPVIENYLPLITRPSDLTTNMIVSRTDFANAAPIKINPSLLKERSIKFKLHYVTKTGEMKEMLIPDDAPFTFQLCFGLTIASF